MKSANNRLRVLSRFVKNEKVELAYFVLILFDGSEKMLIL